MNIVECALHAIISKKGAGEMDNEMTTEKVLLKKEKLSVNAEQLIETDLNLADYYGDIVKILGVNTCANIHSATLTADKAVIEGSVTLRMIYIDSEAKTEAADCTVPFSRSIDIKNADTNDNLTVECISEQATCRALNPRRAEIRGSVTLHICVSATDECEFITDTPEGFCHSRKSTHDGYLLKASAVKRFTVNAESNPDDKYRGAKLCRIFTMPIVSETKTIKNKMMIKGNVSSTFIYMTPDGKFETERITEPVNQIVEMEGIDESSLCCVTLRTAGTDGRFTPATPQSPAKAEISVTISAQIDAYEKGKVTCIDEAYSPTHELICKSETVKCITSIRHITENHDVTSDFDFSSCKVSSVDDVSVRKISYTCQKEDSEMLVRGSLHYGIIITDAENDKMYFERTADFEHRITPDKNDCECVFSPVISINAVGFTHKGNSSVAVTTELRTEGFMYSYQPVTGLVSACKGESRKKDSNHCIITAYFASEGERLWDIAKTHCADIENIRKLNDITGDTVDSDRMLIFEQE